MIIGAQLYTLRNTCQTPEDFAETLKRVADIGYKSVQVSGTCDYDPEWLAEQLKNTGLTCDLTHIKFPRVVNEAEKTLADHRIFGCKYIGVGGNHGLETIDYLNEVIAAAKTSGRYFADNGAMFMYHNHFKEFTKDENGVTRLEALAAATKPDEVGFIFDTFWAAHAGADIVDYISLLSGRLPCVHYKDAVVVGDEVRMAPVGSGNINFEKLSYFFEDAGTQFVFVEQDKCYDEDPFDCMKKSYEYLKSIGLE